MILPHTTSTSRGRALVVRRLPRTQTGRQHTVRVSAFFGFGGAPSGGKNNEAVLDLVNSKFSGPSETGNERVAEAAASFGRVNKNPRSKELYGQWDIVYASGNTGLTALDGKISKFTITEDGKYENECSTKIAGIFPGSSREGGTFKVTGGNKFELLQEYREFTRPGGSSYEEVEDPPIRCFEVLALTDAGLVTRLAATTFFDEDVGKRVTQSPEGEYFLVWRKDAAATAAVAAAVDAPDAVEEEEVQRTGSGSILSGLFGGKQPASLATVAEKNLDGGSSRARALEAQRVAAEERKQAALADKERRRQEAADRKEMRKRQQEVVGDGTEVVTKPMFAFGGFGGKAKKAEPVDDSKTTGVSVKGGLGGFFGTGMSRKRDSASEKSAAEAAAPDAAAQRRQEAAAKNEAARQEAEAKKRAQAEERELKRLEAEAKKQEEAKKKEEQADMRRRIADILADMQSDVRDTTLEVREQSMQLRTAERSGTSAMRAGSAAQKQLETAETAFSKAEGELAEANEIFNEIAGQLRAKQAELDSARSEVRQLENNLLKKVGATEQEAERARAWNTVSL